MSSSGSFSNLDPVLSAQAFGRNDGGQQQQHNRASASSQGSSSNVHTSLPPPPLPIPQHHQRQQQSLGGFGGASAPQQHHLYSQSYPGVFAMPSSMTQDGFSANTPSTHGGPSPVSPTNMFGFGHHHPGVGASDSSSASSPDIASLLPPRHRWSSPTIMQPPPHGQNAPTHSSPLQHTHVGSTPSWFNMTASYDRVPTGADVNAFASQWTQQDFDASSAGLDARAGGDDFRHLPYPQIPGVRALQDHSHFASARAHPYMLPPESSLGVRHRTLGELSNPVSSELPRPVKSGRLGVKRRQKYTRSRTGCLGCRARRIKCDEGRPICRRCQVAKRELEGGKKGGKGKDSESADDDYSSPEHAKKRHSLDEQSQYSNSTDARRDSDPQGPLNGFNGDTSVNIPGTVGAAAGQQQQQQQQHHQQQHQQAQHQQDTSGSGHHNLGFDLSQAVPEGFGIGPLGWDRAFTSEGLSPTSFGFDSNTGAATSSGPGSISGGGGSAGGGSGAASASASAGRALDVITELRQNLMQNQDQQQSQQRTQQQQDPSSGNGGGGDGNAETATAQGNGENTAGQVTQSPLLTTPNFLLPWFPTAQEQSLILHYCANAADLMIAIPVGLNPMLAVNLPLALASPRGTNAACDALRITLLGIGAVHQAFLLARGGVSTAQTAATFQYASNLRDLGKELVRRANIAEGGAATSDAALSASTSLATIDIFFGGTGWQDNFAEAKRMVAARGGPRAILKASTPTALPDATTVTPVRMFLEILAIYETFSCLTTAQEPELLTEKDTWWFETSGSTWEEHSVETQFGMSRVMVHLFSRVARLLARVHDANVGYLDEPARLSNPFAQTSGALPPPHRESVSPTDTTRPLPPPHTYPGRGRSSSQSSPQTLGGVPVDFLDPKRRGSGDPALQRKALTAEATKLALDIDTWIESLAGPRPVEHERVQVGNKAYAYAMRILLLRMVFGRQRDDAEVQKAALEVLQYCSISTAALGMSIDLMWPAVVAGCCLAGETRTWLTTLLEGFKAQCCFDVDTATRIIQEVWRRIDANEPRADWKPVCDDLDLKVLLC